MTQPSGWATATRSYDDQGFPVSTGASASAAPEAPPLAGQQQQNSKAGGSKSGSGSSSGSTRSFSADQSSGMLLAAPLVMFLAGVVVV